jgi:Uma2 family endonuclease
MNTTVVAEIPAARIWTADEFIEWLEPGGRAELIDGEVFMHPPVNIRHANLVNFFDRLLGLYVEAKHGGVVHRETWVVRLSARRVVLPDVAYFTRSQAAQLCETYSPVAPAFAIEVLSPSSFDRDRIWKFSAYEERGVKEYWVIDPEKLEHHFFRRGAECFTEFAVNEEVIHSHTLPGFWVERRWLDPMALPAVGRCLRQLLRESADPR